MFTILCILLFIALSWGANFEDGINAYQNGGGFLQGNGVDANGYTLAGRAERDHENSQYLLSAM